MMTWIAYSCIEHLTPFHSAQLMQDDLLLIALIVKYDYDTIRILPVFTASSTMLTLAA